MATEDVAGVAKDAGRGISKALMGSAFESFGKAFEGGGYTPRGMKPGPSDAAMSNWRAMGAAVQDKMEMRWHQNDFKQFKKQHLDPFQKNLTQALRDASNTTKMLQEGQIPNGDGSYEQVDMKDEASRMKVMRLRGQVESDLMLTLMDMQIGLNNAAAENYASNPIVNNMIQTMMTKQSEGLAAQFNPKGTSAQVENEQKFRGREADIRYKDAYTNSLNAQTEDRRTEPKPYQNADEVMRDMGPEQAARYFTQDMKGSELLKSTRYPNFLDQAKTRASNNYIRSKKWDAAGIAANKAEIESYVNENMPEIEQEAYGAWVKDEWGQDKFEQTAAARPGILGPEEPAFDYDVKTNPGKKETKEKTDKMDALGVESGNEYLRRNPDATQKDAVNWLMEEWLPNALEGRDTFSGGALVQTEGLTADVENKAAEPYLKAVRASLRKAAEKFVATGEGTEGLLEPQRNRRRGNPRGGLGRAGSLLIDKLTPDALFPDVGKGIYPPDFRKQFPKEE